MLQGQISLCEKTQAAQSDLHLRVEEAHRSLNNRDSAIESRVGVQHAHVVLENGGQVEGQVLGVYLGSEAVGCSLLLASRDQKVVLAEGQVADSLGADEGTTNEAKVNGGSLMVGDGQDSVGRVAIDELDTEDLRVGEGNRDGDVQLGSLLDVRILNLIYNLRSLCTSSAWSSQLLAIDA